MRPGPSTAGRAASQSAKPPPVVPPPVGHQPAAGQCFPSQGGSAQMRYRPLPGDPSGLEMSEHPPSFLTTLERAVQQSPGANASARGTSQPTSPALYSTMGELETSGAAAGSSQVPLLQVLLMCMHVCKRERENACLCRGSALAYLA